MLLQDANITVYQLNSALEKSEYQWTKSADTVRLILSRFLQVWHSTIYNRLGSYKREINTIITLVKFDAYVAISFNINLKEE